uniref:mpv17-like protein n=1 Tax=Monopterus albus TaxID=43700 RepID=UPI0009B488D6|nr:mpv17-like protein [Monopterus albus]
MDPPTDSMEPPTDCMGTPCSRPGTSADLQSRSSCRMVKERISAGVSFLEGKEDIMEDWRKKFLNTYKTGLMFWPFMQLLNFAFVPLYVRTAFTGCCAFVWATFLCFSHQSGDGTAAAALAWMFPPKEDGAETIEEKADSEDKVVALGDGKVASKSEPVVMEGPKPEHSSQQDTGGSVGSCSVIG